MKKTLLALSLAIAAFAAVAQINAPLVGSICLPGQGCNDPSAQQVDAKLPGGGIKNPPLAVAKTVSVTEVTVEREIHLKQGETRVYNNLRPFCLNFTPGAICGGNVSATPNPVLVIPAPAQVTQSYVAAPVAVPPAPRPAVKKQVKKAKKQKC